MELHVIPYLGTVPLSQVNREQCRDLFYTTLREKSYDDRHPDKRLSGYALKSIYKTFKRSMQWAVNEGMIPLNPLANVTAPKIVRAKIEINEGAPKELLAKLKGDPDELRWLLAFFGLRQSEALGLTWPKVMTKKNFIRVEQQLARKETQHGCGPRQGKTWPCGKGTASTCPERIGTPGWEIKQGAKTEAGNRLIPTTPYITKLLVATHIKQEDAKKAGMWNPLPGLEDLVFTTENGQPRKHNRDTEAWHALLEKHRIPYQRGHISRHTTATLLASMDPEVPLGVVKDILGHNSTAMSEYYTHRNANLTREPMEALEELLTGEAAAMHLDKPGASYLN